MASGCPTTREGRGRRWSGRGNSAGSARPRPPTFRIPSPHAPHNRDARLEAKKALKYPPVEFAGIQARAVARGFADLVQKSGLVVRACSIMPEHVHLVVDRHRYGAEQVANLLKGAATRMLNEEAVHPLSSWRRRDGRTPRCWERGEWKVFLEDEEDVLRAIE